MGGPRKSWNEDVRTQRQHAGACQHPPVAPDQPNHPGSWDAAARPGEQNDPRQNRINQGCRLMTSTPSGASNLNNSAGSSTPGFISLSSMVVQIGRASCRERVAVSVGEEGYGDEGVDERGRWG